MIEEIWSGGQCGADQAGLRAALDLGIPTGGWMPKGWRCYVRDENGLWVEGSRPEFRVIGLREDASPGYKSRTVKNVDQTDGTFWLGDRNSPGGKLTLNTATNKPKFIVKWQAGDPYPAHRLQNFRDWVKDNGIRVLNVAGNRESTQPGIGDVVYRFLMDALQPS